MTSTTGNAAPLQSSSALTETEAREFIRKEVNAILWKWVKRAGGIVGVTNIAALFCLWVTVQSSAKQAAQDAARSEALPVVNAMTNIFQARYLDLDKTYSDLAIRADKATEEESTTEQSLNNVKNEATRVSDALNGIKEEDVVKAASVVQSILDELKQNPQNGNVLSGVLDTVHDLKNQLDQKIAVGDEIEITSHNWRLFVESHGIVGTDSGPDNHTETFVVQRPR
jgi:hypothetical protein